MFRSLYRTSLFAPVHILLTLLLALLITGQTLAAAGSGAPGPADSIRAVQGQPAAAPASAAPDTVALPPPMDGRPSYASDEVLIQFRADSSVPDRNAALAAVGATIKQSDPVVGFVRLALPPNVSVSEALRVLRMSNAILWAEPVVYGYLDACLSCPQDPDLKDGASPTSNQWGIFKTQAYSLWRQGGGDSTQVIAIIDSGIDDFAGPHGDLRPNVLPIGRDFVPILPDDDPTDEGPPPPLSNYGHGTHVAGIAAAVADEQGIVGVAYCSKIMVIRIADCSAHPGCSFDACRLAQAIRWAVDTDAGMGGGRGATVINLSLGFQFAIPPVEQRMVEEAILYAGTRGAIVVAAAGNRRPAGGPLFFPASMPAVISVGNSNPDDTVHPESCFGPRLDVVAPGGDIWSTIPGMPTHGFWSGTSQAAPFVSGIAALVRASNPSITSVEFRRYIRDHARPITPPDRDGSGRVDFMKLEDWSDAHSTAGGPDYSRVRHENYFWEWLGSDATAELSVTDPLDMDGRPNLGGTHDTDGADDGVFPLSVNRLPYRPPHIAVGAEQKMEFQERVCRAGPRYGAAANKSLHLDAWVNWDVNVTFDNTPREHVVIDHVENPHDWGAANTKTVAKTISPPEAHIWGNPLVVRSRLAYGASTVSPDADHVAFGEVEDDAVLNFVETFDLDFQRGVDSLYATLEGDPDHGGWAAWPDSAPMADPPDHWSRWHYAWAKDTCDPVDNRLILPAMEDPPLDLRELTVCWLELWAYHTVFNCAGLCDLGGTDACRVTVMYYDANQNYLGEKTLYDFPSPDVSCIPPEPPWSDKVSLDVTGFRGGYIRIAVHHTVDKVIDHLIIDDVIVWGFDDREVETIAGLTVTRHPTLQEQLRISMQSPDENSPFSPLADSRSNIYHLRYSRSPIQLSTEWNLATPFTPRDLPDGAGLVFPVPSAPGITDNARFKAPSAFQTYFVAAMVDDEVVNPSSICSQLAGECATGDVSTQPVVGVAVTSLGDVTAAPGETAIVSFTVQNTGEVEDGFGSLAVGSNAWTIDQDVVYLELLPNTSGIVPVRVAVPESAVDGETDTVTLTAISVSDPEVSDVARAVITVGGAPCVHLADHDPGNVRLSVTDQGTVGFLVDGEAPGSGFVSPLASGMNRLYIGGFMAATDTDYVLNRDYSRDPADDWQPAECLEVGPIGDWDQAWRSMYTDGGHPSPRGLQVVESSYAWDDAPNDDYVIFVCDVANTSGELITGLHLGSLMDWDLEPGDGYDSNSGATDADRDLIYMWRDGGGDGTYVGMKAFYPRNVAHPTFVHNPTYIYPQNYLLDSDRFHFLAGDDPEYVVTATPAPDDWSAVLGLGPLSISAGSTIRVGFALVAGTSLSDLQANADAAQTKWNMIWASTVAVPDMGAPVLPSNVVLQAPAPNPFHGLTALTFDLPRAGRVVLEVYDVVGRRVARITDGVLGPGRHTTLWDGRTGDGREAVSGIYYLRLETGGEVQSRKLVVAR